MTNYQRGVYKERKIKKRLEREGWYCIRSAGSHGAIDLVCLLGWNVRCIQAKKNGKISPKEREELRHVEARIGYPIEVL